MEAAEGDVQRTQFGSHLLKPPPSKEGLDADMGDQVVSVLAPFGNQAGQVRRPPELMVGTDTDDLHRLKRRQIQGDDVARSGLLHAGPFRLGRLVETVV